MKNIAEYIYEQYSPLFNKDHNKAMTSVLKLCEKILKSGMEKEDVCAMLDDIKITIEKEY